MPLAQTETLKLLFSHPLPGKIWKIRVDAVSQNLVLEVRQPDLRQTSFWVINTGTGEVELSDYRSEEPWWTGLEDACSGILLLHGYAKNRETGQHLGIQALSEKSGELVWEKPELTFRGLLSAQKLVAENTLGHLLVINLETGAEASFSGTAGQARLLHQEFERERQQNQQFPVPYLPADAYYLLLQEFIRQKTGHEATETIEYAETDNSIIAGYYMKTAADLANFLLVCSLSGEVLLQTCLEPKAAGLGSDTFFIFAEKLFFIQEKSVIAGYLL